MGFASKLTVNFLPKDKDDGATVLASPDTQFGVGLMPAAPALGSAAPAAPASAATPGGSANDAAQRLGNLAGR
jgi:twitching motility protein PilJ